MNRLALAVAVQREQLLLGDAGAAGLERADVDAELAALTIVAAFSTASVLAVR